MHASVHLHIRTHTSVMKSQDCGLETKMVFVVVLNVLVSVLIVVLILSCAFCSGAARNLWWGV